MLAIGVLGFFLVLTAYVVYRALFGGSDPMFVTIERTDVRQPPPPTIVLTDDDPSTHRPEFDPERIDSRPIGEWQVNASAAVIRIDSPMIRGDFEPELLRLYPSYAAAVAGNRSQGRIVLPSANLIDGVGKQIDDGLYAAIERAMLRDEAGNLAGTIAWVRRVQEALPSDSLARAYLQGARELAGDPPTDDPALRAATDRHLQRFERAPLSTPAGFYTWNEELERCWRAFRYLQTALEEELEPVAREIAAVLATNAELADQAADIHGFYSLLSNPGTDLTPNDLIGADDESLKEIATRLNRTPAVTILPRSTSRETELFERLFPLGVPEGVDMMSELIGRIRSGEVDLTPAADEGWYQHQAFALETLLDADRAQEADKLVLTAAYKRRLIEAFKALITKRRETHMRSLKTAEAMAAAPPPPESIAPRLRLEPAATYYLRTARAYRFVELLLASQLGDEALGRLKGLSADGERERSLRDELAAIVERSYGFYLVSCEDIGMAPALAADEGVDLAGAKQAALDWLENWQSDADLAIDTRVVVPVYVDPFAGKMRLWGTIGIRMAKLDASYVVGPKIRPADGSGDWIDVERYQLDGADYLIPVDEFVEFEYPGTQIPTRDRFRAICDEAGDRETFLQRFR